MININAAINYVNNLGNSALSYVANNPGKSVGGFIILDGFTNGFGMSQDMLDAAIANEGLAENSARAAAGEFGEILEETNDVAFNWSDMLTEFTQTAVGYMGTTEDGNVLYPVAEGLNAVTDVAADGEEIAYNSITEGEFTWETKDEWYHSSASEAAEPSTGSVEGSGEMDGVDSEGMTPDQEYDALVQSLENQDESSLDHINTALRADKGLVENASIDGNELNIDEVQAYLTKVDPETEEILREADHKGYLADVLSKYEEENL